MSEQSKAPDLYLIEKRGLYYRPDACGYTGLKSDAGRYSFEEAAERVGPNGPDGSQDGLCMWRENEAPKFSSSCSWDARMKATAFAEGCAKALTEAMALFDKDEPPLPGCVVLHRLEKLRGKSE